jgi:hypothetical protein
LDIEHWTSDFGHWTLGMDIGHWTLDINIDMDSLVIADS